MRFLNPGSVNTVAWLVFLAYWIVSSFAAKRIAQREDRGGVAARVITLFVAWILFVKAGDPRLGVLSRPFMPWIPWLAWLADAITVAGIAFAIWARIHIGKFWSASVALKSEHKLIRSGPYARIRHPIYTGIIFALLGTALVIGRYAALLAFAIYFAGFCFKARKEEALLAGQFGPAFEEHRRGTGFLLPKLFSAH
jgi:protein-S-isoprenylcysteine O-methyltransferase Ste14